MSDQNKQPDLPAFLPAEYRQFIQNFVSSFLGAYAAQRYDQNCIDGWKDRFVPVEDAETLAGEAWDRYCEVKGWE